MFTSTNQQVKIKTHTKTLSSRGVNLARKATRDEFSTNSQPDTTPHIDLLKQTKYAHKQQLDGPRDALLGMSEAVFTVCSSESVVMPWSTSTVGQAICLTASVSHESNNIFAHV